MGSNASLKYLSSEQMFGHNEKPKKEKVWNWKKEMFKTCQKIDPKLKFSRRRVSGSLKFANFGVPDYTACFNMHVPAFQGLWRELIYLFNFESMQVRVKGVSY